MGSIYFIIILLLAILAISDLVIGVSNDAVNFLNSAIGSKVAPHRVILLIASIGIILGVTFSGGMMDIARNGIFNPSKFSFQEIMFIFLAVMITDVILIDFFNTFGLPTSTTTSLIFELIGASIGILLFTKGENQFHFLKDYFNTVKISSIISGILLSIVTAFALGIVVQFFVRIIFTFNYQKTYRNFGAIFGSIVMSSILYFMIIRGIDISLFMSEKFKLWIENHTFLLLLINFVSWTLFFELLILKTTFNIFRFVVLAGTFALAMAFAGNDLVNFIGAPIAGIESFKAYLASGLTNPDNLPMSFLNTPVRSPLIFMVVSGLIMSITLFVSRKSRSVTATEINLSRQGLGYERFEASSVSKYIVNVTTSFNRILKKLIPEKLQLFINARITNTHSKAELQNENSSFDLVRASVNLFVSSILIAYATSIKLPLSTTYVTFMVAMGTAFSDGAWSKENAVFRVSGVITVVGGWFLTCISAFVLSLVIAVIIIWGKGMLITILTLIVIAFLTRFFIIYRRNESIHKKKEESVSKSQPIEANIYSYINEYSISTLLEIAKYYYLAMDCLVNCNRKKIKEVRNNYKLYYLRLQEKQNQLREIVVNQKEVNGNVANNYIQSADHQLHSLDIMKSTINSISDYVEPGNEINIIQKVDLSVLIEDYSQFMNFAIHYFKTSKFSEINDLDKKNKILINLIDKLRKKTLKQVKKEEISTKNSLIYLQVLSNTENILFHIFKSIQIESNIYLNSK